MKTPVKVHIVDFFTELVKLSYIGDIRTYLKAEKKEKARNMVEGSLNNYIDLYGKYFENFCIKLENDYLIFTEENLENMFKNIREDFILNVFSKSKIFYNPLVNDHYFSRRLNSEQRKEIIDYYIKSLNLKYSIYGIISGVFSTDFVKGVNFIFFIFLFFNN